MLYLGHMDNQQNPNPNPVPNEQPAPPAEHAPQAQTPPVAAPEPEPSTPAPQPTPPATSHPEQSTLVLWIVTFLIVAVLVGGYLVSARGRGYWPFPPSGLNVEENDTMEEGTGGVMQEDTSTDLTYQSADPAMNFSFMYPSSWKILEENVVKHPAEPNRSVLFLGLIGPVLELTVQANSPGSGGYTIADPTPFQVSTVQSIRIDGTMGFIEPMGGVPTESETGEERIWMSQFEAAGNEYTFTFISLSGEDMTERVTKILTSFELVQ